MFELIYAPGQKEISVLSSSVEKYLTKERIIHRAFGVDDPLVQAWIAGRAEYPEELKDKGIVLWGSIEEERSLRTARYLYWSSGRVHIGQLMLTGTLNGDCPALTKPANPDS